MNSDKIVYTNDMYNVDCREVIELRYYYYWFIF